jgi:aryl-alcohol dehydrogenase-like predicted oxidoreductase
VRAGKVLYVGASNFSGWQLMKSLAIADAPWLAALCRPSGLLLAGRTRLRARADALGLDQKVGAMVWSPLGWGRLTGKVRRGQPLPAVSRLHETADVGPPVDDERLYAMVDVLDDSPPRPARRVPQIALNWLLRRPTVSSVIIGARNEEQLRQNLGAVGWSLTPEQVARLDAASAVTPAYPHYPYWREGGFKMVNPPPV